MRPRASGCGDSTRFPVPAQFGHDTWKGDSWKTGGGATWLTGTYDPELNTVYWPVGNPGAADRSVDVRGELDNLFSDSVVALDPDTGQRKWHYQFTPNDGHDWDSVEDMVLVDRMWRGQNRKLLMHADRNGHFYVLDRTNGAFLSGTPFVYQNWNKGFDDKGRPQPIPGSNSSRQGSFLVYPDAGSAARISRRRPTARGPDGSISRMRRTDSSTRARRPRSSGAGNTSDAARQRVGRRLGGPTIRPQSAGIKAIDPETGRTIWTFPLFRGSLTNGVLATAGDVVFGASRDGNLIALDAKTGTHLWHFQTGGDLNASPMSYAVGGRQFVAISAGNMLFSFALPE